MTVTADQALDLMSRFIALEADAVRATYAEPDDAVVQAKLDAALSCMYVAPDHVMSLGFGRGRGKTAEQVARASRYAEQVRPRVIFQLRHHRHAELGDLYGFITSPFKKLARLGFGSWFYVAAVAGEPRIISVYEWGHDDPSGGFAWEFICGTRIVDPGPVVEVRELASPEMPEHQRILRSSGGGGGASGGAAPSGGAQEPQPTGRDPLAGARAALAATFPPHRPEARADAATRMFAAWGGQDPARVGRDPEALLAGLRAVGEDVRQLMRDAVSGDPARHARAEARIAELKRLQAEAGLASEPAPEEAGDDPESPGARFRARLETILEDAVGRLERLHDEVEGMGRGGNEG